MIAADKKLIVYALSVATIKKLKHENNHNVHFEKWIAYLLWSKAAIYSDSVY